ncbi:MAG: ATP-binding protein [Armatimonadota bacterium]|nr:ATP-binding protein [Armatimonadota bacterium]
MAAVETEATMRDAAMRIDKVTVDGFWGKFKAEVVLRPDVNIFIGKNGTGKTTLMNLLQAILRVDTRILSLMQFDKVTVVLKSKANRRTVTVTRDAQDPSWEKLIFHVGQRVFSVAGYQRHVDMLSGDRLHPGHADAYSELRDTMSHLVNVASLSVHRETSEPLVDEELRRRGQLFKAPIDQRLENLLQRLTSYQLTLTEQAVAISAEFQKEVLHSLLYSPRLDKIDLTRGLRVKLDRQSEDLKNAYEELGVLDERTLKKINVHMKALNCSVATLRRWQEGEPLTPELLNELLPLPLLRRTQNIGRLSLEVDRKKQEVFKPIKQLTDIAQEFMTDKQVEISPSGELVIKKDSAVIPINQLSSGEKQLLILLIETLLQKGQTFVFLADEPELSLHIEWQAKVIASVKALNPNSQVVAATHSPEIAGGWADSLIEMEEIIHA